MFIRIDASPATSTTRDWGWASWARAWRHYDLNLTQWPDLRETDFLRKFGGTSFGFETYWRKILDDCYRGKWSSTWDYQWVYSFWKQEFKACVPIRNLVSNIGFAAGGVHHDAFDRKLHARPIHELDFPLIHPRTTTYSARYDNWLDRHIFQLPRFAVRAFIRDRVPLGSLMWRVAKTISKW